MKVFRNAKGICWLIALFPTIYMWYAILANRNGMRIFYFAYSAIIIILSTINIRTGRIQKKSLIIIILLLILTEMYLFFFLETESKSSAILFSIMYFYMWIYGDVDFRNYYFKFLKKNEKRYMCLITFYYIGFLVTLLNGTAISHNWGTISLQGPYGLAHIFAYELLLLAINSYLLYIGTNKMKWLIIMTLNLVMMILTNVRSTLLCLLVIIAYYFIVRKSYKKFVVFIIGIISFYFVYKYTSLFTTVIEKTVNAAITGDVTNARFAIWTNSINLFKRSDILHKLFGNGMQKLMDYNLVHIRMQIHAHNEFIDILAAYGLVSFVIYIFFFQKFIKGEHRIGFFLAFFVLAWFNGIYSDCSFVIGLVSFRVLFENINSEKQIVYHEETIKKQM